MQLRNWYIYARSCFVKEVGRKQSIHQSLQGCNYSLSALLTLHVRLRRFDESALKKLSNFTRAICRRVGAGDVLIVAGVYVQYDGPLTRGDPGTFISSLFISLGGHDKMLCCLHV